MGPSGEKWVHGNTYPLLMNQDQKGRIDNLFRSILVFHGQFVRQRDLGSIDDSLVYK